MAYGALPLILAVLLVGCGSHKPTAKDKADKAFTGFNTQLHALCARAHPALSSKDNIEAMATGAATSAVVQVDPALKPKADKLAADLAACLPDVASLIRSG